MQSARRKERVAMRVVAPLLVVITISALAILEVNARANPALWFHVFRSVGWLAIAGMLILIYEKTGTRKLAYTGVVILTAFGILFILIGLFAFFANLYLFSAPIIITGGLWVWFILSRYEKCKEASRAGEQRRGVYANNGLAKLAPHKLQVKKRHDG